VSSWISGRSHAAFQLEQGRERQRGRGVAGSRAAQPGNWVFQLEGDAEGMGVVRRRGGGKTTDGSDVQCVEGLGGVEVLLFSGAVVGVRIFHTWTFHIFIGHSDVEHACLQQVEDCGSRELRLEAHSHIYQHQFQQQPSPGSAKDLQALLQASFGSGGTSGPWARAATRQIDNQREQATGSHDAGPRKQFWDGRGRGSRMQKPSGACCAS
jgi:hypothetical protein